MMTIATINRILSLFSKAFQDMNISVSMRDAERLAILVHNAMEKGSRKYHTSAHVFDIADGLNPLQTLAVLFHDTVYFQLDGGYPEKAKHLLADVAENRNGQLVLRSLTELEPCVPICASIFGFKEGDPLPLFGGMNEFLSAIVGARLLQAFLSLQDLVTIMACIEATIPFRAKGADGKGVCDRLAERIADVNQQFGIGFTEGDIRRVVTEGVLMANQDVVNFSGADPGYFLATTWQLIEESNAPLAAVGVYTISEYRGALMRMEKFLSTLNPETVFHAYQGTPSEDDFASLQLAARKNLAFSVEYLGAKIVSISLIEALALETGGDCPVAMLLGDIRSAYGIPDRVENFLPPLMSEHPTDASLLSVFEKGRAKESTHDLTASPLTAYCYRAEGRVNIMSAIENAKRMFAGEKTPRQFLGSLNPDLVRAVAIACSNISLSRAPELKALAAEF